MTISSTPMRTASAADRLRSAPPARATSDLFYSPRRLRQFTRFFAAEVAAGKYTYHLDANERWHQRIYRDRRVDVWLITWLPEQGTLLHDHGGSQGSFTVLRGELTESTLTDRGPTGDGPLELVERQHTRASTVGFGPRYVHDVRNTSDAPAVSVHAYSRPLTTMTYYDLDDGALVPIASLATDDPEPAFDADSVRRAS